MSVGILYLRAWRWDAESVRAAVFNGVNFESWSVSAPLEGKSSRGTYTSGHGKILISSHNTAMLVANSVYSRADTPWGPFGNLWQPGKASTESGSYKQTSWCPLASFLHEKKELPLPLDPLLIAIPYFSAYKEKMKELSLLSLICSCFHTQPHPNTIYQYGGT